MCKTHAAITIKMVVAKHSKMPIAIAVGLAGNCSTNHQGPYSEALSVKTHGLTENGVFALLGGETESSARFAM